jgi:hypothetical protein
LGNGLLAVDQIDTAMAGTFFGPYRVKNSGAVVALRICDVYMM